MKEEQKCEYNSLSSRICERGTSGCDVRHTKETIADPTVEGIMLMLPPLPPKVHDDIHSALLRFKEEVEGERISKIYGSVLDGDASLHYEMGKTEGRAEMKAKILAALKTDFPTAFSVMRDTKKTQHHPKCSHLEGMLCDCVGQDVFINIIKHFRTLLSK